MAVVGLALGVVLFAMAATVSAHAPGVSVSDIDLGQQRIIVQLGFARAALATAPQTGISASAQDTVRPDPFTLAARLLSLSVDDDEPLTPTEAELVADGADGVVLRLVYPKPAGQQLLRIAVPVLAELGFGHRHIVTIHNGGAQPATEILHAARSRASVEVRATRTGNAFLRTVPEGIHHVLAGPDHVLFIIAFLLPAVFRREGRQWVPVPTLRESLLTVFGVTTAFTVAHALTLAMAVLGVATPPGRWVEVAIAATVVLAALNNLRPMIMRRHALLAAILGLVHGFGFAGALVGLGVRPGEVAGTLAGFNIGVEAAQLAIVALLFPLAYALRHTRVYEYGVLRGGSVVIALVAGGWLVERGFGVAVFTGL